MSTFSLAQLRFGSRPWCSVVFSVTKRVI